MRCIEDELRDMQVCSSETSGGLEVKPSKELLMHK